MRNGTRPIALLIPVALLAGCPDKPKEEEMTIVVREDPRRIEEEKQRLEMERKEILKQKKELNDIEENLRKLSGTGTGAGEAELSAVLKKLQKQAHYIDSRSKALDQKSQKLEADAAATAANPAVAAASGGGGGRPAAAAGPELASLRAGQESLRKDMGSVRASLAGIDSQLKALSDKLDRMPTAAPARVVMPRISSGKAVKRGTAEKTNTKTQKVIRKKGLLISDLPPDVQGHNRAVKRAMADGDFAMAQEYAQQLQEVAKGIEINRQFIEAKMQRLVQLRRERPPSPGKVAEVDHRFENLTKLYTDGKYGRANAEINQIVKLLGNK